jgi:hypothetical protein
MTVDLRLRCRKSGRRFLGGHPVGHPGSGISPATRFELDSLVPSEGIEPPTSWFEDRDSEAGNGRFQADFRPLDSLFVHQCSWPLAYALAYANGGRCIRTDSVCRSRLDSGAPPISTAPARARSCRASGPACRPGRLNTPPARSDGPAEPRRQAAGNGGVPSRRAAWALPPTRGPVYEKHRIRGGPARTGRPGMHHGHQIATVNMDAAGLRRADGRLGAGDRGQAPGQRPGAGCGSTCVARLFGGDRGADRRPAPPPDRELRDSAALPVAGGWTFDGYENAIRLVHLANGSFTGAELI